MPAGYKVAEMTASNNINFSPTSLPVADVSTNACPPPQPIEPEDTLELPVHPGIPEDEPIASDEINLLKHLAQATSLPAVPHEEMLDLFEMFVRVVRGEPSTQAQLSTELGNKNAEIGQLKELLLEAQETIIGLLNDRVLDRAKIAKLESEVRLLPDLQSQANRAMGLAMRAEDVQAELAHVRAEVERLRTSYMRSEQGWLGRLFGRSKA